MLEKIPQQNKPEFNLEKEFSNWESKLLNLYDILINDENFKDSNLVDSIHKIHLLQSKINEIPKEIKDKILENTDKRIGVIRYTNTILYNLSEIRKKSIFHKDDDESQELKHSLSSYLLGNMYTIQQDFYNNPDNYNIDKIELPKNLPYSKNMVAYDFFNLFMHIQRNRAGMSNHLPYAEKAFISCEEPQLNSILRQYDNGGESAYLLSKLYRDGSQEFKEYFDRFLEGIVNNIHESKNADLICDIFKRGSTTEIEKKLLNEINTYFKINYEIDDKDFAESLNYTYGSLENMIAYMNLMEDNDDGYENVCASLNKKYNICEFSRYPPHVLMDQLRNENEQKPYGLIIFPRSDHNGAFTRMDNSITNIYEETKHKHLLRIFEASSKMDVARILLECDKKYGEKNKISFLVLGGHGSIETLDLGSHTTFSNLSLNKHIIKSDFEGKGVQKINKFFVESPAITLISCETGGDGGLIDSVSNTYNAEVVAPRISTGVKDIHVNYDDKGNPHFEVKWTEESANSLYISGKKVE